MYTPEKVQSHNAGHAREQSADFSYLADKLSKLGHDVDAILDKIAGFEVAIPSWALGTGGTRFGRFPGPGEPRNIEEKLEDVAVVHQLTGSAPRVSLHIPWDEPDDPAALKQFAEELNLGFDAVNSNTFQDQAGQPLSYKFGSLSHTDRAVRQQAIDHNVHVIDVGEQLGSDAITIWLADGSNYPGQMHLRKSFERVQDGLKEIYSHLPADWRLFTEHKPYEPAFYATVVQDWGTSYLLARTLGDRAFCLVDLGHHLPNTNIELVVARLISAGKLGGFHFNDSAYGDDDLTTGSIRPYRLFLVFNELVDAAQDDVLPSAPAYMIDQSHNVKDPMEALLQTVIELQRAYARALLVDRQALSEYQKDTDVLMAEGELKRAFETDVRPLVAEVRRRKGAAIKPIEAFRVSGYREMTVSDRRGEAYVPPGSL